jgi:hypothetical protein
MKSLLFIHNIIIPRRLVALMIKFSLFQERRCNDPPLQTIKSEREQTHVVLYHICPPTRLCFQRRTV